MSPQPERVELPTLALIATCYAGWALALVLPPLLAIPLLALALALHSSLQHEIIHGHPTRWPGLNAALVWPALGLAIPYGRFRDQHLAHHNDATLTDPYDDPESNYLDPAVWARLPRALRMLLRANNTLLGRMALGPAIGLASFVLGDLRAIRAGAPGVLRAWAWHIPAAGLVLAAALAAPLPLWSYLVAAYAALSILKIRTFLEHQAHIHAGARTAIVEDRGPLAFLFLNNNFHVVHHMHPRLPWYRIPARYAAEAQRYRTRNQGYVFRSYTEVFARYVLRAKDPVPHPLRPAEP